MSEPQREYLWVLSGTPEVDAAAFAALTARLVDMGFDLNRLELSKVFRTHAKAKKLKARGRIF